MLFSTVCARMQISSKAMGSPLLKIYFSNLQRFFFIRSLFARRMSGHASEVSLKDSDTACQLWSVSVTFQDISMQLFETKYLPLFWNVNIYP